MSDDVTLRMGVFYRSLPMAVAEREGFYDREGLSVEYLQVESSIQQFEYLRDGQYDMVQTSPDNVVNYRYNEGNPVGNLIDGQLFMGMDYGMNLRVVARAGNRSLSDLRGKVLSVDAPESGFAYVLYKILQSAGLERNEDYEVVSTGGVFHRFQQLLQMEDFDATLLSGGFEVRAEDAGFVWLESVYDVASPYLGVAGAARESWLRENGDAITRFIRAYREATRWVFDEENKAACLEILMEQPNTSRSLAERLYETQVTPGVGNVADAGLDPEGIYNVLSMRQEFGGFERELDLRQLSHPGGGFVDISYYEAA